MSFLDGVMWTDPDKIMRDLLIFNNNMKKLDLRLTDALDNEELIDAH